MGMVGTCIKKWVCGVNLRDMCIKKGACGVGMAGTCIKKNGFVV